MRPGAGGGIFDPADDTATNCTACHVSRRISQCSEVTNSTPFAYFQHTRDLPGRVVGQVVIGSVGWQYSSGKAADNSCVQLAP